MNFSSESTGFSRNYLLNINGRLIDLSTPSVMGILNVTPDSFYDGNLYKDESAILRRVESMESGGTTFVDVGGYSTRPGATDISVEEELGRVLWVVRLLKKNFPSLVISIDTFRSKVAEAAVGEGAELINDVSGGNLDDEMFRTVAKLRVPYVMMHMRGTPANMKELTQYEHIRLDIISALQEKLRRLRESGVSDVIVDPGFGFAKTIEQNFHILNNLESLHILDRPLLVGLSRKSMVWKTLAVRPDEALAGTVALNTIALLKGASILRVHDVKEAVQTIKLVKQVVSA